jgi:aminoglycoside phosphotransferase (APT) family kinase protein
VVALPDATPAGDLTHHDAPSGSADPAGITLTTIEPWFVGNIAGSVAPLTFTLVAGGRSNLTYLVDDAAGHRYVLRRPPLGHLLPSAHDMSREHRILAALGRTTVPVPEVLGFCDDPAVSDRPFYVMEFVAGRIFRTLDDAASITPDERRRVSESLVDVLASLHALDVNAVGLGQLGKHDGYIARQLSRWHAQFTASKLREVPLVDEVHARLSARIPIQQAVSIVHGDYRLDNTMIGPDNRVAAVLDWEICTLGDPLADIGMLHVYSPASDDPNPPLGSAPTQAPGFLTAAEMTKRYAATSPLDLSDAGFYVAFGCWKLACILDGVYTRYATGAMANDGFDFSQFDAQVQSLAVRAAEVLENA